MGKGVSGLLCFQPSLSQAGVPSVWKGLFPSPFAELCSALKAQLYDTLQAGLWSLCLPNTPPQAPVLFVQDPSCSPASAP